jgi:hypothetical protein
MVQAERSFDLGGARAHIEGVLEAAGFDVVRDPGEPNLIQARRDLGADSASIVVDAGGQLRYSRTRRLAPARSVRRKGAGGQSYTLTRTRDQTLAVLCRLAPEDPAGFAEILADLQQLW